MHLQACGVIFKPYLKWNSVVETFDIFYEFGCIVILLTQNLYIELSFKGYLVSFDQLIIIEQDIGQIKIIERDIGPFNILYCDI